MEASSSSFHGTGVTMQTRRSAPALHISRSRRVSFMLLLYLWQSEAANLEVVPADGSASQSLIFMPVVGRVAAAGSMECPQISRPYPADRGLAW